MNNSNMAFNMNVVRELYLSNKNLNEQVRLLYDNTSDRFQQLEGLIQEQNRKMDMIIQQTEIIISMFQTNQTNIINNKFSTQSTSIQDKLRRMKQINNNFKPQNKQNILLNNITTDTIANNTGIQNITQQIPQNIEEKKDNINDNNRDNNRDNNEENEENETNIITLEINSENLINTSSSSNSSNLEDLLFS